MWKVLCLFLNFGFIYCWIEKDNSYIFHVLNLRESFKLLSNFTESVSEKFSVLLGKIHFWEISHVLNEFKWLMENGGIFFEIEKRCFDFISKIIDILVE